MLRLTLVTFFVATATASAQPATIVSDAGRATDSILTAAAQRGFSGVALLRKNGQPILRKAYGIAQRETGIPFTTNTVVQIGSNTKDFTIVAIFQLIERGKLSILDTLGRFFPNAPADKRGITVRQLLNHRSGLPHAIAPDSTLITRADFLERVMRTPLAFAPGSSELYSNPGYSVLAAIIEQVAGTTYDRYVGDNILTPVGLRETGYILPGFDKRRLAHGYNAGADKGSVLDLPHPADGPSWTLRGNGGMVSTLDEMALFYETLFGTEKLLPTEVRDRQFDPRASLILGGSDRTSYFMYQREPQLGLDVFLASTTTEAQAPMLLRAIMPTLGLRPQADVAGMANAPTITLPATPAAMTVAEYLEVFHKADSTAAVKFFTERFVPNPEVPPPAQRLARLRDMRSNLRKLEPLRYTSNGDEVELQARAGNGEVVTLMFDIESAAPYRIRSLRVRVGD